MMGTFPIKTGPQTQANFAQRYEEGVHEGTDIFAPAGAEVVAVADGKVRHAEETKGGRVVYLTTADGTQYYYSHLDAWADPLKPGKTRKVKLGDVLGYVGNTGNAKGKAPHVHFEMRPAGGAKVDPFPFLSAAQTSFDGQLVAPPRPASPFAAAPPSHSAPAAGFGGAVAILILAWALSERG